MVPADTAFSESMATAMVVVMNASTALMVLLAAGTLTVVRLKSPKQMESYTFYLTLYIVQCVLVKVAAALCKPVLLTLDLEDPVWVIYSVGWLAHCSHRVLAVLIVVTFLMFCQFGCCYSVLTLERFYALTCVRSRRLLATSFLLLTAFNTGAYLLLFWQAVAAGALVEADVVLATLRRHMLDADVFLATHPGAMVGINMTAVPTPTKALFAAMFGISGLCVSGPLILTVRAARHHGQQFSVRLRQMNAMLLRATVAQFVGVLVFTVLPFTAFFLLVIVGRVPVHLEEPALFVGGLFAVYDMIAILVVIRPYRKAVAHWLHFVAHLLGRQCRSLRLKPTELFTSTSVRFLNS